MLAAYPVWAGAIAAGGVTRHSLISSPFSATGYRRSGLLDQTEHRLAVLGAGVMGVAITTMAIGHGVPVVLVEIDDARRARAPAQVAQQLRMAQLVGGLDPW